MFSKSIMSASLIFTSVSAVALSASPAQAQAVNFPVPYVQCVKNVLGSSGIIAKVKFYDPGQVTFIKPDPRGDNVDTKEVDESLGQLKLGFAEPVLEKNIAVGQDACVGGLKGTTPPRIAVVSVVGGKYAIEAVKISIATLAAGVSLLSCPVTAGAGCAAALAIASGGADAAAQMASLAIPEAKEVFYIGFPVLLELSGTVFDAAARETALGVAALPYRVNVDYCIAGLQDTTSSNNITVDFLAGGKIVQRSKLGGGGAGCSGEASMTTADIITSVRVNTDGGDGMLIDQVQVFRSGNRIFWDGRDNGGGWCLSTDANDHIGGWEGAVSGGCAKSHSFSNPAN